MKYDDIIFNEDYFTKILKELKDHFQNYNPDAVEHIIGQNSMVRFYDYYQDTIDKIASDESSLFLIYVSNVLSALEDFTINTDCFWEQIDKELHENTQTLFSDDIDVLLKMETEIAYAQILAAGINVIHKFKEGIINYSLNTIERFESFVFNSSDIQLLQHLQQNLNRLNNNSELPERWMVSLKHISTQIEFLKNNIDNITKDVRKSNLPENVKTTNVKTGFISDVSKEEIEQLYNKMINIYIGRETTLVDFESIFEPQPLIDGLQIRWLKYNNLLAFFVYDLFKGHNNNDLWNIAQGIFVNKKGEAYDSLRQSYYDTKEKSKTSVPSNYYQFKNLYSFLL
jgi:hypothetical protein